MSRLLLPSPAMGTGSPTSRCVHGSWPPASWDTQGNLCMLLDSRCLYTFTLCHPSHFLLLLPLSLSLSSCHLPPPPPTTLSSSLSFVFPLYTLPLFFFLPLYALPLFFFLPLYALPLFLPFSSSSSSSSFSASPPLSTVLHSSTLITQK